MAGTNNDAVTAVPHGALAALERRGVITIDVAEAATCCGIERDGDGFCQHRPGHRVFVDVGNRRDRTVSDVDDEATEVLATVLEDQLGHGSVEISTRYHRSIARDLLDALRDAGLTVTAALPSRGCPDCGGALVSEHGSYEFADGAEMTTFIKVCVGRCRRRFLSDDPLLQAR